MSQIEFFGPGDNVEWGCSRAPGMTQGFVEKVSADSMDIRLTEAGYENVVYLAKKIDGEWLAWCGFTRTYHDKILRQKVNAA